MRHALLTIAIASLLLLPAASAQTIPNPGHSPSEIGPGTFYGSGTWTFPGNVVASGTICGTDGCAGEGGGGGTCACPWASQSPGLFYSGSAGVSGDLWANRICENGGTSCISIDAIGSGGGTCTCTQYWNSATLAGTSGIAYNGYIGAAKYCDTTGTTCKSINEMGGAATCDCPSIWTEPSSGNTYYMGNVGIGTSSPLSKLDISDNGGGLTLSYASDRSAYHLHLNTVVTNNADGSKNVRYVFSQRNNNVDYNYILSMSKGNVGIGSDTPSSQLSVGGNGRSDTEMSVQTASKEYGIFSSSTASNSKGVVGSGTYIGVNGIATGSGGVGVYGNGGSYDFYGSGKSYFGGGVGIGAGSWPLSGDLKLDVNGKVGATQYCDQNGANCKSITTISPWQSGSSSIYYPGRVGVGTSPGPTALTLRVNGPAGAASYCDPAGGNCFTSSSAKDVIYSAVTDVEVVKVSSQYSCSGGRIVYCPDGKMPIGGGCSIGGDASIQRSFPTTDGGWACFTIGSGGNCEVYAICANY